MPISHIELDSLSSLSLLSLILPSHTTHTQHTTLTHSHYIYAFSPSFFFYFQSRLSLARTKNLPHISCLSTQRPFLTSLRSTLCTAGTKGSFANHHLLFSFPILLVKEELPVPSFIQSLFSSSSFRELVLEDGRAQPKATSESTLALSLTIRLSPSLVTQPPTAIHSRHSKTLLQDRFAQRSPPTYLQYQ